MNLEELKKIQEVVEMEGVRLRTRLYIMNRYASWVECLIVKAPDWNEGDHNDFQNAIARLEGDLGLELWQRTKK